MKLSLLFLLDTGQLMKSGVSNRWPTPGAIPVKLALGTGARRF